MKTQDDKPSMIASVYRDSYTVYQLERMQRVTGQCFPVSGDLWLLDVSKQLKISKTIAEIKLELNARYGKK